MIGCGAADGNYRALGGYQFWINFLRAGHHGIEVHLNHTPERLDLELLAVVEDSPLTEDNTIDRVHQSRSLFHTGVVGNIDLRIVKISEFIWIFVIARIGPRAPDRDVCASITKRRRNPPSDAA